MDPAKRSQIGAHYTSSDDIRTLLEPVMMTPLRREWAAVQAKCEALLPTLSQASGVRQLPDGAPSSQIEPYREAYASRSPEPRASRSPRTSRTTKESPARRKLNKLLRDFIERLAHVTVLDPACGSGNFLYVALRLLLDLEKEVITFAAGHKLGLLPQVRPTQLHGIEINPFAQELAQVVIWIGYLQWMRDNGFNPPRDPVLEPIESIQQMDAILDLSDPEHPKEPEWPAAEFIVGNPPFLGDKLMRGGFGDDYVDALRSLYGERIPAQSDLCCYWFEKGRKAIERKRANRCGLLATQGIRGGANRAVLQRIAQTGSIFFAESDREWILDGANVHVSMVGFDDGTESVCILDRANVVRINPNLTATADITAARAIGKNAEIGFIGVSMHGDFDVDEVFGASLLDASGNPTRNANSDVVRPILNAIAITRRDDRRWVVAFPPSLSEVESAHYEQPFEYVKKRVKPIREQNRRSTYRQRWWVHGEARPAMQLALFRLNRYVVTPRVSKHRLFVWVEGVILPSDATVAFARDDDYFFGVLHSHPHELWALKLGTRLETRPRYTPTTCFETFPFPEPTDEQRQAIAAAAAELDQLRTNWLNPPEWTRTEILEFPGSTDGPWARFIDSRPLLPEGALLGEKASPHGKRQAAEADQLAAQVPPGRRNLLGTVRYPRLVPLDEACAKELKKRTLTNLYNQRPAWLDLAHKKLDEAVFAAYGWPPSLTDDELLAKLLALNLERSR
ncbi:MAG: DNA methyltransferase [Pirellulaceae bacterium]